MSSSEMQPAVSPPGSLRTVLIVVGSVLLATVFAVTILWLVTGASTKDTSGSYPVVGEIESLMVSADVAEVEVRYGEVASAEIHYVQDGSAQEMLYEAQGNDLRISVARPPRFGQWLGEWLLRGGTPRLTVVLPHSSSASPPNLTITNSVGSAAADGRFGVVDVRSDVGEIVVKGSALRAELRAETGSITAEDFAVEGALVSTTDVGNIQLGLVTAPETLEARSDVGSVDAFLPPGDYRIDAATSLGSVRQRAVSHPEATRVYRLSTSVGDVTVSPR